jgi:hypothetical protein
MFRFNCHGRPIFDERFQESINKWANAKGVNPEHVFTANDWDESSNTIPIWGDPPMSLSMIVKNPINTSVFEEAEVIE